MPEVTLAAATGRNTGSATAGRLRAAGRIPAVLYGHGIEPVSIDLDGREFRLALSGEAGLNALLDLDLGGTKHLAMARDIQRHPVRNTVVHVDFVVVRRDEVVTVEVPVTLVGEAEDVLSHGGAVDQQIYFLAIQAKPASIPHVIEVDISNLAVGHAIRVGDLALGVDVGTEVDADTVVVAASGSAGVEDGMDEAEVEAHEAAEGASDEPDAGDAASEGGAEA